MSEVNAQGPVSIDPQMYAARLAEAYQEQLHAALDGRAKFAALADMQATRLATAETERDAARAELDELRKEPT
jgi:hypothetical protein